MTLNTNLSGYKRIKRYTVNRSPFVSKRSRDQLQAVSFHGKRSTLRTIPSTNIDAYALSLKGSQMAIRSYETHSVAYLKL
jgi:hypothetical protein